MARRDPIDHGADPTRDGTTRPTSAEAGFGLIEAILALAIAGMVLAAVTEIAGRTLTSWDRGLASVAAVERTDVAIGRIGADLATLLPVSLPTADDPSVLFAGDERGLAFTAVTPLDRTNDGIAIVEIGVEGSGDGAVLVRRLRRGRDVPLRDGDRVVLLSGALDFGFSYRDQSGQRSARWAKPGEVPRGVIVTLKSERGGGGLPVEVMLPIPVAVSVSCLVQATAAPDQKPPEGEPAARQPNLAGTAPNGAPDVWGPAGKPVDRSRRCATGPSGGEAQPSSGAPTAPPTGGQR